MRLVAHKGVKHTGMGVCVCVYLPLLGIGNLCSNIKAVTAVTANNNHIIKHGKRAFCM